MHILCIGPLRYDVFDLVVIGLLALTAQLTLELHAAAAGDLKTAHGTDPCSTSRIMSEL